MLALPFRQRRSLTPCHLQRRHRMRITSFFDFSNKAHQAAPTPGCRFFQCKHHRQKTTLAATGKPSGSYLLNPARKRNQLQHRCREKIHLRKRRPRRSPEGDRKALWLLQTKSSNIEAEGFQGATGKLPPGLPALGCCKQSLAAMEKTKQCFKTMLVSCHAGRKLVSATLRTRALQYCTVD